MRNLLLIFLLLPLFLQGQMLPSGYGRAQDSPCLLDSAVFRFSAQYGVESAPGVPATNNQLVYQVLDMCGSGRLMQNVTSVTRPTYKVNSFNGRNSIYFPGVDEFMLFANPSEFFYFTTFTFFVVVKADSTGSDQYLFDDYGSSTVQQARLSILNSSGDFRAYFKNSTPDLLATRAGDFGDIQIYSATLNSSKELFVRSNDLSSYSYDKDASYTLTGFSGTIRAPKFGTSTTASANFFKGHLFEFIGFSRALSMEEQDLVFSELSTLYKTNLNHPIKPITISPNHLIIRDPTQVKEAPLEAWWGPGGIVGSPVSYWNDLSGNNHNWYQSNSSYRATVATKNGYNVLSFDGTNDYYAPSGTSLAHPDTFTIIFVAKVTAKGVNNNNMLFTANPTYWNDGGMFINMEEYGSSTLAFGAYYPNGSWGNRMALDGKLMTSIFGRYGSNEWHVFAGRFMLKQTIPYSHVVYLATEQYLAPSASQNFKGSLAEVYWYSGYLSEKTILGLMRGLGEKYNLPID